MKAEIEKILEEFRRSNFLVQAKFGEGCSQEKTVEKYAKVKTQATTSLTSLIIKWLESKKETRPRHPDANTPYNCGKVEGRNQLLTELIGEVK